MLPIAAWSMLVSTIMRLQSATQQWPSMKAGKLDHMIRLSK